MYIEKILIDVFYYCKLLTGSKPSQFLTIYAYLVYKERF